ncbi:MAG: DUF1015 family protein [Nitrospira sp.]|nr:DUF1015 family protein [Nitrospira sp.]
MYRQVMGRHAQVGLVAAASCQEYLDGVIKKHELTRVDKEDDRVRHIDTLDSQTGPVFLTYRAVAEIDAFVQRQVAAAPYVDFVAKDGVRHTSWRVSAPGDLTFLREAFARIPNLYIADGHHRSAAAGRVFQARRGAGASGGFLTVIFPHNQMQILPYNRVLKDLNGQSADALMERLETVFEVRPGTAESARGKHQLGLYLSGRWHALAFRPGLISGQDAIGSLDVSLLQRHVLDPMFGIQDPRTSKRIHFVGGIRGTAELERLVESGEYACAFSMFATGIEDLMTIADQGGIMPPKSTWFEPKLRDAMFCLMLDR